MEDLILTIRILEWVNGAAFLVIMAVQAWNSTQLNSIRKILQDLLIFNANQSKDMESLEHRIQVLERAKMKIESQINQIKIRLTSLDNKAKPA